MNYDHLRGSEEQCHFAGSYDRYSSFRRPEAIRQQPPPKLADSQIPGKRGQDMNDRAAKPVGQRSDFAVNLLDGAGGID